MAKKEGKNKPGPNRQSKESKTAAPNADFADAGSVDKIRDILFGNQMRDFERRFSQMEDRMAKATLDLRDEIHKRLEALELFFKEELEALKKRLKAETDQRVDMGKQQSENLKNRSDVLEKAIAQAEEKFSEHATDLRQQILQQSKTLSSEIQSKHEQASQELRKTADGLDDAKIDRSTMAEYLIEMAMRMSDHSGGLDAGQREN